jgi:hypothetical protein
MFDKTLATLLRLSPEEAKAAITKTVSQFRKALLAEAADRSAAQPLLLRLSAATGLSAARAAEAAALVLTADAHSITPGTLRPHLRSVSFLAMAVLFFWSAWYLRPATPEESPRVAVRGSTVVAPFTPITRDHLTTVSSRDNTAFESVDAVVGRYASVPLAGGTVLVPAALSAGPFASLGEKSLVSVEASSLPASLSARLPVHVMLAFSPKPQSSAPPVTFDDVWIVAEERNAKVSRLVVAVTRETAQKIGGLLASSEAAIILPR